MGGPLAGKIFLVAGATRGAGRGIARMLGAAGAVVYCTGRSSRAGGTPPGRPETIEETAELVSAGGGHGVARRVDHADPAQVATLVAGIDADHDRLDVLVNDIWGGEALAEWGKPFWEQDLDRGFRMVANAVNTHIITSRAAVPLMLRRRGGLIVEITDGDGAYYRSNFFYDLAKASVLRVAFAMSEELRKHGVAAMALTPGFLRSEEMLEHFGVREESWRDGIAEDPHFAFSETPWFVGRAVAALAADPAIMTKSGRALSSWLLAREYGFTDQDGSTPDWGAHIAGTDIAADQAASQARFFGGFARYDGGR